MSGFTDCLEFGLGDNAITVKDNCCAPCCGCTELEAITKDLERFLQQQVNLEVFDITRINSNFKW